MTIISFKHKLLEELYSPYQSCADFPLYKDGATNVVLGRGNPDAQLMIIGEAPGREEDHQKKPFVGRSGILLNKALEKLDIDRETIFITNVVKCRPPNNRTPTAQEIASYAQLLLFSEIKIVQPSVILLLGSVALQAVLATSGINKLRGKVHHYGNSQVIATYHPAYILRNPPALEFFMKDLQIVKNILQ